MCQSILDLVKGMLTALISNVRNVLLGEVGKGSYYSREVLYELSEVGS